MARYIDADKLLHSLPDDLPYKASVKRVLMQADEADVVEVRHGEWIEDGYNDIPCACSHCGAEAHYISTFSETFDYDYDENLQPMGYEEEREYIKTPYCPHCGAKMDGKVTE